MIDNKDLADDFGRKRRIQTVSTKKPENRIRAKYMSMDAYSRHKELVNNYFRYNGSNLGPYQPKEIVGFKSDLDTIKENHKFLWDEDDVADTWGKKLAKKYYDKLYHEYCLANFKHYKHNKVGMRWRTEEEVIKGKGQFICGSLRCVCMENLRSWEVNFTYLEKDTRKHALIKLRLCLDCSKMLNYSRKHRQVVKTEIKVAVQSDECPPEEKVEEALSKVGNEIWRGPLVLSDEKTREEEFDEFLADMLM